MFFFSFNKRLAEEQVIFMRNQAYMLKRKEMDRLTHTIELERDRALAELTTITRTVSNSFAHVICKANTNTNNFATNGIVA